MTPNNMALSGAFGGQIEIQEARLTIVYWGPILRSLNLTRQDAYDLLDFLSDDNDGVSATISNGKHGIMLDVKLTTAFIAACYSMETPPTPLAESIWARILWTAQQTEADYIWILDDNI